jgi:hypothetical protein
MNLLPMDIVNHILSYDNRFKIRKGMPISIIPKDDFRYSILKKFTRCRVKNERIKLFRGTIRCSYEYDFTNNLYDIQGFDRDYQRVDNDNLYVEIDITNYNVSYSMIWFRLKPKELTLDKKLGKNFYVSTLCNYSWDCFGISYDIKNCSPSVRQILFGHYNKN